jgi:putative PEP-CTERM system histidine kinase
VVPLIRHDRLFGIIVVGRSRVHRDLSWEDFDLLKTVGRHAASYLAEQAASEALVEARQFDAFNKRFAFVAHDLKNAVSQLSLIVANMARHRDNAHFRQDASETLRQSVEKLNRLLRQLSTKAPGSALAPAPAPLKTIALAPLLEKMVAERRTLQEAAVSLTVDSGNAVVVADEERLTAVIGHLIQNAVDAARDHGIVNIRLSDTKKMAIVEVEDNGPGMDADFVRDKLFRPFATTKGSGYGIGVYESREYAQALGGRLDVFTRPGSGTIMRVMLPICQAYDGVAGA